MRYFAQQKTPKIYRKSYGAVWMALVFGKPKQTAWWTDHV